MTSKTKFKKTKKIRNGDKVCVIAGNCKGQTGTVIRFQSPEQVVVQGVNLRKKHVKPTQENPKGNIIEIEKPIHVSNVSPCDDEGSPLKLKIKRNDDGEKVLYYRKDDQEVIHRSLSTNEQKK